MSKRVRDIGEFGLIERIARRTDAGMNKNVTGIGDDTAVIPLNEKLSQLITCDTLIEHIHFIKEKIPPKQLGYKSLAVNLSDIAAMGGIPRYVFMALAVPSDTEMEWVDSFLKGFYDLANKMDVLLLGGDTTRSENNIMITCTVLGEVDSGNIKRRSDAKTGDLLFVTGTLGDSGMGLRLLLADRQTDHEDHKKLIQAHYCPVPFCREGAWLGRKKSVHAMIDISDGLISDAGHIARSSDVGILLEADRFPVSNELRKVAEEEGVHVVDLALSAGEDYRLLFSVDPAYAEEIRERYHKEFGTPCYEIGSVVEGKTGVTVLDKGQKLERYPGGFDHFKT